MRFLWCILWLGLTLASVAGCQGWDVGPRWLGDGSSDPDSDTAMSDRGVGRNVAGSLNTGTQR